MSEHSFKFSITAIGSVLSALLGALYVPVMLMVLCNLIDYITGLMAAKYRDGISSYKSMKGIFKKVAMWLLVVVGSIIDGLLKYACEQVGFQIPFDFLIASVVAIWIICNEIISILENMVDIGINIPPFLIPLVKDLKNYTEQKATIDTDSTKDNDND